MRNIKIIYSFQLSEIQVKYAFHSCFTQINRFLCQTISMKLLKKPLFFLLVLIISQTSFGSDFDIHIIDPFILAVPASSKNTSAYMMMHNHSSTEIDLISAESDISEAIELHSHSNDNGVMRMRLESKFTITPNGYTLLEPGSSHLMILNLKKSIQKDEKVKISLKFSNGEIQNIEMVVKDYIPTKKKHQQKNKHRHH